MVRFFLSSFVEKIVKLDGNHLLAGKGLTFSMELVDIDYNFFKAAGIGAN